MIKLNNHLGNALLNWKSLLLLGLVLVVSEWIFLQYGMNYDILQPGDVLDYWNDSLNWQEPYNPFHVPGYPFALAAVRSVAGGILGPNGILLVTILIAFSVSVVAVYRVAGLGSPSHRNTLGLMAATLFILWPLVGTTYVAFPIADVFGTAPLFIGLWFLMKKKPLYAAVFLGLVLISHKALWPFAGFLLVANVLTFRTTLSIVAIPVAAVPLGILWALGSFHHDSATWLVSANLGFEVQSTSGLPVLDGIIGSMINGGMLGLAKGLIVLAVTIVSLVAAVAAWRLPHDNDVKWYALAIIASVLIMVVMLNEREIWASVRFGRLLAVPLVWLFGGRLLELADGWKYTNQLVGGLIVGLISSQFVFGFYMAKVWSFSP